MTLSNSQIAAVQESFLRVAPRAEELVHDFYSRLFRAHPCVRALFSDDMTEQRSKLIETLSFVVSGLSNVETITNAVRELGVRHSDYGAEPAHYDAVGEALLGALAAFLGPRWTDETREGWTAAYQLVAATMLEGAAQPAER